MYLFSIRTKILCIIGMFILSGTGLISPAFGLEIMVKDLATVDGDTIHLGDIASFDPKDDSRIAQLREIEISSAPPPGVDSRLNERLLLYKIGPLVTDDDIVVKVPENMLVRRSSQFVSANRLGDIFREYILTHSQWPAEKLRFEKINTPGRIALPVGTLHWKVQEKQNRDPVGNIALVIEFWVNGRQARRVHVSGRISLSQEVVKAARKIDRGEVISDSDLTLIEENNLQFRKDTITTITEAVGKRSVRSIQAGQIILSNMIETPPLVKKGNSVLIKAETKEIRITAMGKVLEDGRSGDQVRVVNINSGKEIFATVTGPGMVEVSF